MLLTRSGFRAVAEAPKAKTAFPKRELIVFGDREPISMFSEDAIRASKAVFFYVECRACNANANLCGAGKATGAASVFDVVAGCGAVVHPGVAGANAGE